MPNTVPPPGSNQSSMRALAKRTIFGYSFRDLFLSASPSLVIGLIIIGIAIHYIAPAPPTKIVITTGDGEGNYAIFAKQYKELLKEDGIDLEIQSSKGAMENLVRLENDDAGVDVGFVQDGVGSPEKSPDLVSLGSLYYEPVWIFVRKNQPWHRLSELTGKRLAVGEGGSGTQSLVHRLLRAAGVDSKNAQLIPKGEQQAVDALRKGDVDVAFFISTPEDDLIRKLMMDPAYRLMNLDQAEAISRQNPYLHHLTLPHGAIDLRMGIPDQDIEMVAPTATLLARDDLHPSMVYLLLRAVSQVHDDPGIFEKKKEFPIDNNYQFPISDVAEHFYKTGLPFWQRYLPYWAATLLDRFLVIIIPLIAVLFPIVKVVPNIYRWRIRRRIYRYYGELKFLETQIDPAADSFKVRTYYDRLDDIEERVNLMKVPLEFSEHIYSLRGHIDLVRSRLQRFQHPGAERVEPGASV